MMPEKLVEAGPFARWAVAFNRLREEVRSSRIVRSPDILPSVTALGTSLRVQGAAAQAASSAVKMFRVITIADDSFVAAESDGVTDSSTQVTIAKPYKLRRTPFHGMTLAFTFGTTAYSIAYAYTAVGYRTATILAPVAQAGSERQAIIPLYRAGADLIFAATSENGTGVTGADWIDLNADGRAWARY